MEFNVNKCHVIEMEAVLGEGEGLNRFGKVSLKELKDAGKWTVLYFYPLDL